MHTVPRVATQPRRPRVALLAMLSAMLLAAPASAEDTQELAFTPHPEDEITLALVRCNWLTCPFAEWVVPGGTGRALRLRVDNQSPGTIEVTAKAWLQRTPGENYKELSTQSRTEIDDSEPKWGTLEIPIGDLPAPGTYEGSLVFAAEQVRAWYQRTSPPKRSSEERKLTMHVRAGPVVPLLVILLGVLLGRAALYLARPESRLKIALFPRLVRLEDAAALIRDPAGRVQMERKLGELRREIARAKKAEAVLGGELDTLGEQIDLLQEADGLEAEIRASALPAADQKTLAGKLATARRAILDGRPGDAAEELDAVEVVLKTGRMPALMARAAMMKDILGKQAAAAPAAPSPSRPRRALGRVFAVLSGTGEGASLEELYWFWRPVAFCVLLAALTAQGFLLLYAGDAHQAFGSQGPVDYVPLLLWGLGTDVANRTLQEISLPARA